jgi:hypothetical protein
MEEPKKPKDRDLRGTKGLGNLLKYLIELKIFRHMSSGLNLDDLETKKSLSPILSQI